MKLTRSTLLLLAMLAISGCKLDHLLTTPREPGPVSFTVNVDYDDSDYGVLRVIASLLVPRGRGYTVTNDTAYVAGSPMSPIHVDRDGRRFYDAAWLGTSMVGSMPRVMVVGPAVDGAPPVNASQLAIYRRDGSAAIELGSGALQLPLSVPSVAQPAAWSNWELSLLTPDDALVQIHGTGAPPNPLVISRSLLPAGSGDVRVRLSVTQTADVADDVYWLRTYVISKLNWTVRR